MSAQPLQRGLLLEAVGELARVAGDVAQRHFAASRRARLNVETKADGSPVTIADREAEQAARDWIARRFPDDGVLGEELGESRPGARRRWILDPIDGTKSFVRGVPLWGTLVALAEGETILAGAAYFPAVEELLVAAPGEGCWWNGARCHVSAVSDLAHATLLVTDDRFRRNTGRKARFDELSRQVATSRTWGDCYGYLLVATGRAEIMLDDVMNPWDAAAVLPIITEAGGVFTDWRGRHTAFGGSAIGTNAALADAARGILTPVGAREAGAGFVARGEDPDDA